MKSKKGKLILLLLIVSFIIVGCTEPLESGYEIPDSSNEDLTEVSPEEETTDENIIPEPEYDSPHPQFTKEDFLEDFDYMIQMMEDTFPYFGVAYRRLGVDIRELAAETREIIENYPYSFHPLAEEFGIPFEDLPELNEQLFWSILHYDFFRPLVGMGHTGAIFYSTYHENTRLRFFTREQVVPGRRFYEAQEEFFLALISDTPELIPLFFRRSPEDFFVSPLYESIFEPRSDLVFTEIIEEGSIAYLHISSFHADRRRYRDLLLDFYQEIEEFDHLIIDIRDNGGGGSEIWRYLILYTLWPDPENLPTWTLYAFFNDTEPALSLTNQYLRETRGTTGYQRETNHLLDIHEIIEANELSNFYPEDLFSLGYGVVMQYSLARGQNEGLELIPFHGRIWLLINEYNFSSSSLFARHSKESGFATLVGEQVGGAYTLATMPFFSLPNTGIIVRWDIDYLTDAYGVSIEEFPTTPHYFNRPGLDALETVLQMIAEGY